MSAENYLTEFKFDSRQAALSYLPARPERSNKGDFGRVLCVCGSYGMAGAAFLCAKAAYRMGAGLVEILTPESNRTVLQAMLPEAVLTAYGADIPTRQLIESAVERADTIVAGCGLGVTADSRALLSDLLHIADTSRAPLILDADALNLLSKNPSLLKYIKGAVITPHAKEMSRLCGTSVENILSAPDRTALLFAQKHETICLLKDHRTVVTDGSTLYINGTGNSGMSTGGSGDVLAGMLGGLFAQRKNGSATSFELTCLGAYLHGLCGDLASAHMGEYSIMASDIIAYIPKAISSKKQ